SRITNEHSWRQVGHVDVCISCDVLACMTCGYAPVIAVVHILLTIDQNTRISYLPTSRHCVPHGSPMTFQRSTLVDMLLVILFIQRICFTSLRPPASCVECRLRRNFFVKLVALSNGKLEKVIGSQHQPYL